MKLNKIQFLLIYLFYSSGYSLFSHPFHTSPNELKLVNFNVTYDLGRNLELFNERISSEEYYGDTLFLTLATIADCGQDFEINVQLSNDTLNIHSRKAINDKEKCECSGECGYKILLKIVGLDKNITYNYKLNDNIIYFSKEKYTGRFLMYKKDNEWIKEVVSLDSEIDTNLIYGNMAIDEYPKVIDGDTLDIVEYINKKLRELMSKDKIREIYNGYINLRGVFHKDGKFTLNSYEESRNKRITNLVIKIFEQTTFVPAKIMGINVTLECLYPVRIHLN